MSKKIDITGTRFHRWVAIRFDSNLGNHSLWLCRCDCGTERVVDKGNLMNGLTKSCGCYKRDYPGAITHGKSKSTEYLSWASMMNRCNNPKGQDYALYGGRGIKVCESWHRFEIFYADMGTKPKGKSLDRYPDKNGNYEPSNCRWATQLEQCNNTRKNRIIEYNGKRQSASEWSRELKIPVTTIIYRLNHDIHPIIGAA